MAVKTYSLKKDGPTKLSANFIVREFACGDGSDKILIDDQLVLILQKIRDHFGRPLNITSAYRNEAYNKKVGGVSSSYHTKGQAADIYISGVEPAAIAAYAEKLGVLGVGLYTKDRFVHVDTRTLPYLWRTAGSEVKVATHGGLPTYGSIIMDKAKLGEGAIDHMMKYDYSYDLLEKLALAIQ